MNPLFRWCRFNLVGAVGVAVQLSALAPLVWFHLSNGSVSMLGNLGCIDIYKRESDAYRVSASDD
jgi:hypothetical protein